VFQYFMISIVIVPILLGVQAASPGKRARDWRILKIAWLVYAVLWFCALYYLRYRWR